MQAVQSRVQVAEIDLNFDKFSSELQMGIILKAGTCYPTFDQIYDIGNEVINVINKT